MKRIDVTNIISSDEVLDQFYTESKEGLFPKAFQVWIGANGYSIKQGFFIVSYDGVVKIDPDDIRNRNFMREYKLKRILNESY